MTYRDVICEGIHKQSKQLSALLEKTNSLRFNEESVPSGFRNDSSISDEELSFPHQRELRRPIKPPENTPASRDSFEGKLLGGNCVGRCRRQDTIDERLGVDTTNEGVDPKEAKEKMGYKRSVKYW